MQHNNCTGFCTKHATILFCDWREEAVEAQTSCFPRFCLNSLFRVICSLSLAKLIANYILHSGMASQEEAEDPTFLERAMPDG